jgi:enediyne biosynthesis protein E4
MSSNVTYKELTLLLRNDRKGCFRNVQESAGPAFQTRYDARGLAVGDYDNDGDIDVAIVRLQDTPVLLRNNAEEKNNWVGLQLVGTQSNRDAIGAKLTARVGDRKLVRWITGGASIFSSHDHRVVFGLGGNPGPPETSVEIRWPNGVTQTVDGLASKRYHKVVEPPGRRP